MWSRVKILPRHRLTDESVEVAVQPRGGKIQYKKGQFVVLEVKLTSGIRRSAFSIVRAEGNGIILGVKRNGDGGISAWLNGLKAPAHASMAGPFGQFQLDTKAEKHVFITGGSGITPVRSMFDRLLEMKLVPVLIYANRSPEQSMYLESFRTLAKSGFIELIEVYDRDIHGALEKIDLQGAALYACGPAGLMDNVLQSLATFGITEDQVQTEKYGLAMGTPTSMPNSFFWKSLWRRHLPVPFGSGRTMLESAREQALPIPHACEVGVCGACRAKVIEGNVLCGKDVFGPGEEILTCISQPHGSTPPTIGPPRGGRAELVTVFLLIGVLVTGIWWVPPGQGFKALGPMNTSHENLECAACHKEAPGTFRQQVGHNARSLLGLHETAMVSVGFSPVDNNACMDCHNRPNDRHPVSRFLEPRFAEQRAAIGPHVCNNCHGEHQGQRVAMAEPGFCIHCHQDTEVMYDNVEPSHAELITNGAWETCLQCHDYHGNHLHDAPKRLSEGIPQETILNYLKGGADPFGSEKTFTAEYP